MSILNETILFGYVPSSVGSKFYGKRFWTRATHVQFAPEKFKGRSCYLLESN